MPASALQNFGVTLPPLPDFQRDTQPDFCLPSLESLKPPRSLAEARMFVALGSSLCQAGRSAISRKEELGVRTGVAALKLKLGTEEDRGSAGRGEVWVKEEKDIWPLGGGWKRGELSREFGSQ